MCVVSRAEVHMTSAPSNEQTSFYNEKKIQLLNTTTEFLIQKVYKFPDFADTCAVVAVD